ncbi:MAG: hypothetical protein RRC07_16770 [Anaerolineae bacterium]|nr:hypothetical protein [Anaerolineae bacterium]
MSSFAAFARRCKMRHDFADRFQVRYQHPDGDSYDTWVSGEEVLSRLRSAGAEERLRKLGRSLFGDLATAREAAKKAARRALHDELRDRLGDGLESLAGGNPFGDGLVESVRGKAEPEAGRWPAYLDDETFRAAALELAWINLRGSFPEPDREEENDEWV